MLSKTGSNIVVLRTVRDRRYLSHMEAKKRAASQRTGSTWNHGWFLVIVLVPEFSITIT